MIAALIEHFTSPNGSPTRDGTSVATPPHSHVNMTPRTGYLLTY